MAETIVYWVKKLKFQLSFEHLRNHLRLFIHTYFGSSIVSEALALVVGEESEMHGVYQGYNRP